MRAGKTRYIPLTEHHISAHYPPVDGLPLQAAAPLLAGQGGGKPAPSTGRKAAGEKLASPSKSSPWKAAPAPQSCTSSEEQCQAALARPDPPRPPPPPVRPVLKMPPAKQETCLQTGGLKPSSKAINPFVQTVLLRLAERVRFPIRGLTAPARAAKLGFTWRAGEGPGGRALPRFIGVFQRCVQLLEALLQRVALVVLDQLLGRMERHPAVSAILCVTRRDGAHAQRGYKNLPASFQTSWLP